MLKYLFRLNDINEDKEACHEHFHKLKDEGWIIIVNIEVQLGFCVYNFLVFFVKVSSSALKKNFLESKWREYTIGNRSFQYTSIQPQTLYCHYLSSLSSKRTKVSSTYDLFLHESPSCRLHRGINPDNRLKWQPFLATTTFGT